MTFGMSRGVLAAAAAVALAALPAIALAAQPGTVEPVKGVYSASVYVERAATPKACGDSFETGAYGAGGIVDYPGNVNKKFQFTLAYGGALCTYTPKKKKDGAEPAAGKPTTEWSSSGSIVCENKATKFRFDANADLTVQGGQKDWALVAEWQLDATKDYKGCSVTLHQTGVLAGE